MEEVGAKVSDIQAKLGHNSLATTSIYLSALRRPHNPHGDSIAALFGIQDILDTPTENREEKKCEVCGEVLDVFAQCDYRRRYCSEACANVAERMTKQEEQEYASQDDISIPVRSVEGTAVVKSVLVQQMPLWEE